MNWIFIILATLAGPLVVALVAARRERSPLRWGGGVLALISLLQMPVQVVAWAQGYTEMLGLPIEGVIALYSSLVPAVLLVLVLRRLPPGSEDPLPEDLEG